jgi:hypothetical protein
MTMKLVVGSVCILSSIVLFPLFAIGTIASLFAIALGIESLHSLTGAAAKRIDDSAARAMAMHICHSRATR